MAPYLAVILACVGIIQALSLFIVAGLRDDLRDLRNVILACPNCRHS